MYKIDTTMYEEMYKVKEYFEVKFKNKKNHYYI